ncbi:hypothetical protein TNCV_2277261 [Trichonephila clavipes]|nr:hypothetical protein TNCV_2277261 [Trichonephila clavipes]
MLIAVAALIGSAALSKVGSDSPGIAAAIVDDVSSTGVGWSHQASSCSQAISCEKVNQSILEQSRFVRNTTSHAKIIMRDYPYMKVGITMGFADVTTRQFQTNNGEET